MWAALLLLVTTAARADMPLPSYRDHLARGAWVEVDRLIVDGRYTQAVAQAERFQRHVTRDAGLEYLMGLALRMQGEPAKAEQHLRAALLLDPDRQDAWSDLGELLLAGRRFDEAEEAFQNVDRLLSTGRHAWIGPFRLGEIAAHRRRPEAFETHMREALRRGFTFRTIERDPNWVVFYTDPALRDSIDKLVTVYGDPRILEGLNRVEDLPVR